MSKDNREKGKIYKGIYRSYVTVSDAAEMVGVTPQTIRNWLHRGMLRGRKLNPRGDNNSKLLVRLDDINELLESEDSYLRDIDIKR